MRGFGSQMIKSYEDLEVYQRAYDNSLKIHKLSLSFPQFEQFELGSQLRRATKSIPLNIAEGYGKKASPAEFKRFLTMALGSNDEVRVQLRYCRDLGYLNDEQYVHHDKEYVETGKMLMKLLNTWH